VCLFCLIPKLACVTCLSSSSRLFNIDFESLNEIGRRRSLSNNDRNGALGMLLSGLSCRNGVWTLGVTPSTISILFNPFNATNSVCDSARSGRPRVTTQRQDNVIRTLNWRNRTLNAHTLPHELRTAAGVSVSDQTIRNGLRIRNFLPYVSPLLGVIGDYVWIGVDAISAGQHISGSLFAFRT
jgi:transposase